MPIDRQSPFDALQEMRNDLPIHREEIRNWDRVGSDLKVGDIILRCVSCFTTGEKEVQNFTYTEGRERGYVVRALTSHDYCTSHPVVGYDRGLIVFIEEKPKASCIGFRVTSIAKSGKVAWADQITGSFEKLKQYYYTDNGG